MKIGLSFLLSALLLVSCARTQGTEAEGEHAFVVPSDLADRFAVKDKAVQPGQTSAPASVPTAPSAAPAVPAAEAPAEEAAPKKKGRKGRKGKKEKAVAKKAKTAEDAKEKADTKTESPAAATKFENRWTMAPMFDTGEKYRFDITYFGATAGEMDLETLEPKEINGRMTYHFRAVARTASVFSLFYRLNDECESFVDTEGLFTHKFTIKLNESMQTRDVLELYDQKAHKVYYWSKLDHKKKGISTEQTELATDPYTQDGLSAFYYVRTLPLEIGKTYEFPVVNNGKQRRVRVTAVRKEKLKTKIGSFPAIVVKPEVVLDGVLQSHGDTFIWISDDPRRLILKIDAKIKVGSVIAYLKDHSDAGKPTKGE